MSGSRTASTLCPRCGGESLLIPFTFALRRSSTQFAILRNVPADVCQECGESEYSLDTTAKILAMLSSDRPPTEMTLTPVYDLS